MKVPLIRRAVLRSLGRLRARTGNHSGTSKAVCLFKPDGIGDFVLAVSTLRRIVEAHGEENCEFVVTALVAELARAEFPRAKVFALPAIRRRRILLRVVDGWFKWRRILADIRSDTVFCLRHHRGLEEQCALQWLNARRVIGLENSLHEIAAADQAALPVVLTEVVTRPLTTRPPLCLEMECHRQLLCKGLGRDVLDEEILPQLASVKPTRGDTLLMAPFSSSVLKDYPDERLVEALTLAKPSLPSSVKLAGSVEQRGRLERLRTAIKRQCGVDAMLIPGDSLNGFLAAVASARAVLTVDTAAAHIATALDKPTVILHNGTRYGEFGPWQRSKRQRWLVKHMDCFGCGRRCSLPAPSCIQDIEPAIVAAALVSALADA